jgi:hypothetical protein
MSKNGKWFFTWKMMDARAKDNYEELEIQKKAGKHYIWKITLNWYEISLHCSSVGSTPVGLWAHGWNKKKEPSGAFYTNHQTK